MCHLLLIISAIILLVISYLIIQKDLREKARTRKRLEDTIQQNTALLEMRKNIILTISHDIRAPLNVIDAVPIWQWIHVKRNGGISI